MLIIFGVCRHNFTQATFVKARAIYKRQPRLLPRSVASKEAMALFLPLPVSIVCSCMCTPVFRSISPAILSPSVTGFLSCPSPTINLATSGEWGSAVSGLSQGGGSEAELQPKSSWCIFAIKSGINIYPNPPHAPHNSLCFQNSTQTSRSGF